MTNRNTAEVSIHLMLLFIGVRIGHIQDTMDVSIHLMLLFINAPDINISTINARFNTSHVTLYRIIQ